MDLAKIETALSRTTLFQGLAQEDLSNLAEICFERVYEKSAVIMSEGQAASGFFIVAEGEVKVYKSNSEGKEKILHLCGPGESFAEVVVFYGKPYPASASAIKRTRLLAIPRDRFVALLEKDTSLSLNMLANLSMKLRRFSSQIEDLALREVPARIASHIVFLSDSQGGKSRVTLRTSKAQLANLLGTTPESLSRTLANMVSRGLIALEGRSVELLDLDGLRDLAS
ncbi:Crp/Fnr family transcriptional regulator [Pelagicoccus albus]|uniref:Crp/Fnr family transcriptional regulator n=1 Tax=Pelagicoccus albus TaxID=415222 RepID=A0A7X1E736_9BACT|nr:Crp/Fnr family transcriptional regulator [Pelagicoccus albus]MBC2604728.1 Crp/Fnr family transcriptional regulator [Pelagicoccus albus]